MYQGFATLQDNGSESADDMQLQGSQKEIFFEEESLP
jgi:hypothetical protein